ncbi:hypothetical protein EVAR_82320_1 [Eumeta japonica]|uniref:Uncharacterized protein n=1 Tax=Eumeta variegata TaxID=151549 RepID=A0A4C1UA21_EUMVA|nr:hypothetical protein EVAR_82320_1 [Eumeta japonica]
MTLAVLENTDKTKLFLKICQKVAGCLDPQPVKDTTIREGLKPCTTPHHAGTVVSALGEDIISIMSILQMVRRAEVADLTAKFRKANHGVDRL